MRNDAEHELNEVAFDRLKDELERTYPLKQFVAFGRGQVIGDDADFFKLVAHIRSLGRDPREVMVVRIGDEEIDGRTIFCPFMGLK